MREFYIENEIGERRSLQYSNVFFNDPKGLGFTQNNQYVKASDGFFETVDSSYEQPNIVGDLIFSRNQYEEYKSLIDWLFQGYKLKFVYKPLSEEFYMDVQFNLIDKGEIKERRLPCPVSISGLSPWYQRGHVEFKFTAPTVGNTAKYPCKYPARYTLSSASSAIEIEVDGHFPAEIYFECPGTLVHPVLTLKNKYTGKIYGKLDLSALTFAPTDTLIYSSMSGNTGVWKLTDGVLTELNQYNVLDNNFFKIPTRTPCILTLGIGNTMDSTAEVQVYRYFRSV